MYFALCTIWPTKNQKIIKEMNLGWESQYGDIVIAEDGTRIAEQEGMVQAISDSDSANRTTVVFGGEEKEIGGTRHE